jgi:hypothetical protein
MSEKIPSLHALRRDGVVGLVAPAPDSRGAAGFLSHHGAKAIQCPWTGSANQQSQIIGG